MIAPFELGFQFDSDAEAVFAAAFVYVDYRLCAKETDSDRAAKKKRVCQCKWDELDTMGLHLDRSTPAALEQFIARSTADWPEGQRTLLLIEVCFRPPFFPYELKCKGSDVEQVLGDLTGLLRLPLSAVHSIRASMKSAQSAHRHLAWGKIMLLVSAGAVGGYFLAPAAGAALGAAAGLQGIAATAHGLALLGGGTLATGGYGMAGGLWLVTGTGAVGLGGARLLYEWGHARAARELVKLQVTFRHIIIGGHVREATAKAVIERLLEQINRLEERLEEERRMNEKNCKRLEELERILRAYKDAKAWMEKNQNGKH